MTDEELIYNQCIYTRRLRTSYTRAKKINNGWDTMSKCKTYTKIPGNENLAKPKSQKRNTYIIND